MHIVQRKYSEYFDSDKIHKRRVIIKKSETKSRKQRGTSIGQNLYELKMI